MNACFRLNVKVSFTGNSSLVGKAVVDMTLLKAPMIKALVLSQL